MSSVRILGPVEAWAGEQRLALGGSRQVALLAMLAVRVNQAVSSDLLIDAVWGDQRAGARKRLQMAVARLRQALAPLEDGGDPAVRTVGGGYLLALPDGELDAEVFGAQIAEGRAALRDGEPARAVERLSAALELWRGPPLAEVSYEEFAQSEVRRLEELRLLALEARVDAQLQLGQHDAVIAELEGLLVEQPARERIAGQLMLALYRSGRQADALQVYQQTRSHLAQELGLEPGPELTLLQTSIFKRDPDLLKLPAASARDAAAIGIPLSARIPPKRKRIIGRARELDRLCGRISRPDATIVTITGPGGAGKTTLALEVAREVHTDFPAGVTVLWLAEIADARQVVAELGRSLGVELGGADSAVEALALSLSAERRLIVLDNFEHVLDAAGEISRLSRFCPGISILATSRSPLGIESELVYPVAGLEVSDGDRASHGSGNEAVALFVERAVAGDPTFELTPANRDDVAELCRRLDGLPLAVELAAARMRIVTPGALLELLERDGLHSLTARRRDAPERHRSLQSAINWSYELLTEGERSIFVRLSIFRGGFDLEAVASVCSDVVGESALLDPLGGLVDASLLTRVNTAPPQFLMLETIREFAGEKLAAGDADEAHRRHANYYACLAERAESGLSGRDQRVWLEVLDRSRSNLQHALQWSALGDVQPGLRIAAVWRYWRARDLGDEILNWLVAALETSGGDEPVRARGLIAAGVLAHEGGRLDRANQFFRTASAIAERLDDPALLIESLNERAWTEWRLGDLTGARDLHSRALTLAEQLGDPRHVANVLKMAACTGVQGEATLEAVQDQALQLFRSLGDRIAELDVLVDIGYGALLRGELDRARAALEEGLGFEGLGAAATATLVGNLGLVELLEGHVGSALVRLDEALPLAVKVADAAEVREAMVGIAAAMAVAGQANTATGLAAAAELFTDAGPLECEELLRRRFLDPSSSSLTSEERRTAEEHARRWSRDDAIRAARAAAQSLATRA